MRNPRMLGYPAEKIIDFFSPCLGNDVGWIMNDIEKKRVQEELPCNSCSNAYGRQFYSLHEHIAQPARFCFFSHFPVLIEKNPLNPIAFLDENDYQS